MNQRCEHDKKPTLNIGANEIHKSTPTIPTKDKVAGTN